MNLEKREMLIAEPIADWVREKVQGSQPFLLYVDIVITFLGNAWTHDNQSLVYTEVNHICACLLSVSADCTGEPF